MLQKKNWILALCALVMMVSPVAHAGWTTESIGGFTTVQLYIPSNSLSPVGNGRSLMVVLHGCAQTSADFLKSKLEVAAEKYGMVIAVPEAQYKEGFACWGYWIKNYSRTHNDYKNLISLAQTLTARADTDIDVNQVYIAGLSSGGAFAMQMGCIAPDIFAGMGLIGAPSAGTDDTGAVGVIHSNPTETASRCKNFAGSYVNHFATQITVSAAGTSDHTVSQDYAPQNAKAMALVYGFDVNPSRPAQIIEDGKANEILYADGRVSQLALSGEGHAWPGGAGASGLFIGSASINFATYLGRYFADNNQRIDTSQINYRPTLSEIATQAGNPAKVTLEGELVLKNNTHLDSVKITVNDQVYPTFTQFASYNQDGEAVHRYNAWFNLQNNGEYRFSVSASVTDPKGNIHKGQKSVTVALGTPPVVPEYCIHIPPESWPPLCKVNPYGNVLGNGVTESQLTYYTVTAVAGAGGSVSPQTKSVAKGGSASFDLIPSAGYEVSSASGCGGALFGNTFTTGSITAACTVNVSFKIKQVVKLTISTQINGSGTISPTSRVVDAGDTALFTVTPSGGYKISSVVGCDGQLTAGNTFTIYTVQDNCTITATFEPVGQATYQVTAVAGSGGKVSPTSRTVNSGEQVGILIQPDAGYEVSSASGCSGSRTGLSYTTGPVTANCQVDVLFKPVAVTQYFVNSIVSGNGTVSPPQQYVNENQPATFTVTAASGNKILSVSGCDGSLSGNTFFIPSVTSQCSVIAVFEVSEATQFKVTAIAGANGSVSPAYRMVAKGGITSFDLTPASGYEVDSANGCSGALRGTVYTTGAINAECTVNAYFKRKPTPVFTVTTQTVGSGNISPTSKQVNSGESAVFTLSPSWGYITASASGCGGQLSGNTYTINSVKENCVVTATFAKKDEPKFQVTAVAGAGGSVSPTSQSVTKGGTASFNVLPASGYEVAEASGCGGVLNGTVFTTGAITAECTVNVSFSLIPINDGDGDGDTDGSADGDGDGDIDGSADGDGDADPNASVGGGAMSPVWLLGFGLLLGRRWRRASRRGRTAA